MCDLGRGYMSRPHYRWEQRPSSQDQAMVTAHCTVHYRRKREVVLPGRGVCVCVNGQSKKEVAWVG